MMNSSKNFGRKALFVAVSAMALSVGGNVFAATADLAVSADVIENCSISTSPLDFGNYDPIVANASTAKTGTGSVSITCTVDAEAVITLGQGANADSGSTDAAPARRMKDGGTNYLSYSLFSDSGSTVWGNTVGTAVTDTGTGSAEAHTVYGSISGGQNLVPAGAYSDTVVATVSF